MIQDNHLQILISVLKESCVGDRVVSRSVIFSKFESKAKSGLEIYRFNKSLSALINDGTISGYEIKQGCKGGVYSKPAMERITITCHSGKFIGEISKQDLSRLVLNLKKQRKR